MKVVKHAAAMQRMGLAWRREGAKVSFVPTMGCLHEGHLSLMRQARRLAGGSGLVVVSIYVNPTQFGPREDFAKYPRDLKRDLELCASEGVDVVFTPDDLYCREAGAEHSTSVLEESLSRTMEGVSRPAHFRGVTTVVAKLFNLVQPTFAVFGAKDWQQSAIVKRMVRDLNFPVEIVVAPTVREPDGLAMSSRNKYLEGDLRRQAVVLSQALGLAREAVRGGPQPALTLAGQLRRFIERQKQARVDYLSFFNADTLQPVKVVTPGNHMALAVLIGTTRLIDNSAL